MGAPNTGKNYPPSFVLYALLRPLREAIPTGLFFRRAFNEGIRFAASDPRRTLSQLVAPNRT